MHSVYLLFSYCLDDAKYVCVYSVFSIVDHLRSIIALINWNRNVSVCFLLKSKSECAKSYLLYCYSMQQSKMMNEEDENVENNHRDDQGNNGDDAEKNYDDDEVSQMIKNLSVNFH